MTLTRSLQDFLNEAIEESPSCTVEGSFSRTLTKEEINYINEKLKNHGYSVNCFECETCNEYSDGKAPFHIERVLIR